MADEGKCPECGAESGVHKINCKKARADREAASGKEPAAYWTTDQMVTALLRHTVEKAGSGVMGLALKDDGHWVVSAEYGHEEDEGEPTGMVGAATYGTGDLRQALMRAGADAGIWIVDDSEDPGERQQRILIAEAAEESHLDSDYPMTAVQGSFSLLADADEAYVFHGDRAVCIKHRAFAPFQATVTIQRRPRGTDLGPDLTLVERGETLGAHIGIPLAHAEALLAADAETATAQQEELAAQALDEMRKFVADEKS
jgi:hypothetical protein